MTILRSTIREKGVAGLYSGCSALVIGNSVKAGVRFVSYDHFKNMLADGQVSMSNSEHKDLAEHILKGNVSAPRSLLGT